MNNIIPIDNNISIEHIDYHSTRHIETPIPAASRRISRRVIYASAAASCLMILTPYTETNSADAERTIKKYFSEVSKEGSYYTPSIKDDIMTKVSSFSRLPENWDGYGAIPALGGCIDNSFAILESVDNKILSRLYAVYPNTNGTVSFRWKNYMAELYLEVGNMNFSYYFDCNDTTTYYDNKNIIDTASLHEDLVTFL